MNDGHALLAASRERPQDDTPHLVYADWLDDNNMPHAAAHIREVIARMRNPQTEGTARRYITRVARPPEENYAQSGRVSIVHHSDGAATVSVVHPVEASTPGRYHAHEWQITVPHTDAVARLHSLVNEGHTSVGPEAAMHRYVADPSERHRDLFVGQHGGRVSDAALSLSQHARERTRQLDHDPIPAAAALTQAYYAADDIPTAGKRDRHRRAAAVHRDEHNERLTYLTSPAHDPTRRDSSAELAAIHGAAHAMHQHAARTATERSL